MSAYPEWKGVGLFTEEQTRALKVACNRLKISPEEAVDRIYANKAPMYMQDKELKSKYDKLRAKLLEIYHIAEDLL